MINNMNNIIAFIVIAGFDFISKYGLDGIIPLPGVKKITGTNEYQTAYRITRRADFRIPTR